MVSPKKGTNTSTLNSAMNQNAIFLSDIYFRFYIFTLQKYELFYNNT